MLVVFPPIFMSDTKIIFRHDFVAPLVNLLWISSNNTYLQRAWRIWWLQLFFKFENNFTETSKGKISPFWPCLWPSSDYQSFFSKHMHCFFLTYCCYRTSLQLDFNFLNADGISVKPVNFYSAIEYMPLLKIIILSISIKCNNNKVVCWKSSLNVSILK